LVFAVQQDTDSDGLGSVSVLSFKQEVESRLTRQSRFRKAGPRHSGDPRVLLVGQRDLGSRPSIPKSPTTEPMTT